MISNWDSQQCCLPWATPIFTTAFYDLMIMTTYIPCMISIIVVQY